jgi:serine/threonine-protein kinase RsbW
MTQVELRLPPNDAFVGIARLVVTAAARQSGMAGDRVEDLRIAVSEATTNAIRAHQRTREPEPVVLRFGADERNGFTVTIVDIGPGFDPAELTDHQSTRDWTDESGLGLTLIQELASDVEFERTAGMSVRMSFTVDMETDNGEPEHADA